MSSISSNLTAPPNNFSTTLSGSINASALTIGLNSVTGLPTEGVGVIFKKDADNEVIDSSVEVVHWTGISSLNLTLTNTGDRGLSGSYGAAAQSHDSGDYFEVWVTSQYYDSIRSGFVTEHNTSGTHKFTQVLDSNGNESLKLASVASAVNEVTVTNAATGNAPTVTATGGDTNIDLTLAGKGTGKVRKDAHYGTITTDSDGATVTFNMATSNLHTVTLGGNRTLALSNVAVGQCFILRLVQDATGSRTVTWFTTIKWAGGSAPTLTTTASKTDVFGFLCTSSGNYDGFVVGQNL